MEEIYPPENFNSSIRFPLKGYFQEFNTIFPNDISIVPDDDDDDEDKCLNEIWGMMGDTFDVDTMQKLSESCSVKNLSCDGENTKAFPIDVPESVGMQSKLPHSYVSSPQVKTLDVYKCKAKLEKERSVKQLTVGNKRSFYKTLQFTIPDTPPDLSPGTEFVVSLLVYKPFSFNYCRLKNTSEKLRFGQEILALGKTTLDEIRDNIVCSTDEGLCKEVQVMTEDLKPLSDATAKYPSGFIFIDSTFYNDFRSPKAIDYSKPIMEWLKEKNIGEFEAKDMSGVTVDSLSPRLGYPYLYMHQGDCEHLLVFSDARLLQSTDCLHSKAYPHVNRLNRGGNKTCFLCGTSFAKWICVDSSRLPQDKIFLCTACCKSYNFIGDEKVGDFKLYPYFEKHVIS